MTKQRRKMPKRRRLSDKEDERAEGEESNNKEN
jgi:hypothetical protein